MLHSTCKFHHRLENHDSTKPAILTHKYITNLVTLAVVYINDFDSSVMFPLPQKASGISVCIKGIPIMEKTKSTRQTLHPALVTYRDVCDILCYTTYSSLSQLLRCIIKWRLCTSE